MPLDPWYRVVTLRKEVREGRSFSPDEFAIALEQVVSGSKEAPADYTDPEQFFSRTYFTRALTEHSGMVLRRLSGRTENTAPVVTLVTQFGGGKTHTLTSLYHLAKAGREAGRLPGVSQLLFEAGIPVAPDARVGAFSSATPGTPPMGGIHPGLTWPGNWQATKASPLWAKAPGQYLPEPMRYPEFSPPQKRRCCCCSTRY